MKNIFLYVQKILSGIIKLYSFFMKICLYNKSFVYLNIVLTGPRKSWNYWFDILSDISVVIPKSCSLTIDNDVSNDIHALACGDTSAALLYYNNGVLVNETSYGLGLKVDGDYSEEIIYNISH